MTVPNGTIRTTSAVVEWEEIPEAAMYHVSAQSTDSEEYGNNKWINMRIII